MMNDLTYQSITFSFPWGLILIPILILLHFVLRKISKPKSIAFSDLSILEIPVRRSWRLRLIWLPRFLDLLIITGIILCIADPQSPDPSSEEHREKRIVFVLDVSGSMGKTIDGSDADDASPSRLDLAKSTIDRLLLDENKESKQTELQVALVSFANTPKIECSFTSPDRVFIQYMKDIRIQPLENRTDLGGGIAHGCSLIDRNRTDAEEEGVIVVFSDGAHNQKEGMDPGTAGRIAESLGIRIHTVAIGFDENQDDQESIDLKTLKTLSDWTAGQCIVWNDSKTDQTIHNELSQAELNQKSSIGFTRFESWNPIIIRTLLLAILIRLLLSKWILRTQPVEL